MRCRGSRFEGVEQDVDVDAAAQHVAPYKVVRAIMILPSCKGLHVIAGSVEHLTQDD